MSALSVVIKDRAGLQQPWPRGMVVTPTRYSWHALGGPEAASFRVSAPSRDLWQTLNWLRCELIVYNARLTPLWYGYISKVEVQAGAVSIGLSLDDVANSIAVLYDGFVETPWYTNAGAAATYGTKELLMSASDLDLVPSEAMAQMALAAKAWPVPLVRVGDYSEPGAVLEAKGWYTTLGWRYYANTATAATATTAQIAAIVAAEGEFVTATEIEDASGLSCTPYREGNNLALDIIERLLQAGVSGGRRLLASVKADSARTLRVFQEPAQSDDLQLGLDGLLRDYRGGRVEAESCPVARWVQLRDVLPLSARLTGMADPGWFFVERSEYDVERGRLTLEPRGVPSPWETIEIEEG